MFDNVLLLAACVENSELYPESTSVEMIMMMRRG